MLKDYTVCEVKLKQTTAKGVTLTRTKTFVSIGDASVYLAEHRMGLLRGNDMLEGWTPYRVTVITKTRNKPEERCDQPLELALTGYLWKRKGQKPRTGMDIRIDAPLWDVDDDEF